MGLLDSVGYAVGAGLNVAAEQSAKVGMAQIDASIQAARDSRLQEMRLSLEQTKREMDSSYSEAERQKRSGAIREGVNAEIGKRYGDQANALETDDMSEVRTPSRAESLQVRHDVAADLGYDDAAANALRARDTETKAEYYGGRGRLESERVAQGSRRLDLNEDLNSARIDNLDASTGLAAARTDAVGKPKLLTLVQRSHNAEIDAARGKIARLDQEAIKTRTQRYSATGRENPEYDDQLANHVKLANKRKVGEDEWFDNQNRIANDSPAVPTKVDAPDPAKRFAIDPAMKGMRMGDMTPQGREVLDSGGNLIGHYR